MNDTLFFKGSENTGMLGEIETFRLNVWKRLIDTSVAAHRFGIDPFDRDGWHVVHRDQGEIIACGRLVIATEEAQIPDLCSFKPYSQSMTYPIGILNRLVVHREHAGNGLGTRITMERIKLAARQGVAEIWVEVQTDRTSSMEQLGFQDMGASPDTTIDGCWRIMRKK